MARHKTVPGIDPTKLNVLYVENPDADTAWFRWEAHCVQLGGLVGHGRGRDEAGVDLGYAVAQALWTHGLDGTRALHPATDATTDLWQRSPDDGVAWFTTTWYHPDTGAKCALRFTDPHTLPAARKERSDND
jgi:hypothetical protein